MSQQLLTTTKNQLDEARAEYIRAKSQLELMRQRYAEAACPLHVGDEIRIRDRGREHRAIVEYIGGPIGEIEMLGPVVGAEAGWAASGHQLKVSGERSKWSFAITSFEASLDDGVWIVQRPGWLEKLGIE